MKEIKSALSYITICIALFCCTSFTSDYNNKSSDDYLNYGVPISQLIPGTINKSGFSVLVQKSSYTLFLKYHGRLIKSYPCVFGPDPIEDKRMQGDNRTPEGHFYINEIVQHDLWGYFIGIDYPNESSWNKHNTAKAYAVIPSEASIGGDIGIHGVVDGLESFIDRKNNWTEGCVSVKNQDIYELARYLVTGSPVRIVY